MVISNDSLLVYNEYFSAARLKVHHLGQDIPPISWEFGAYKGEFNTQEYLNQIQYDENRGISVSNDSCIMFLYSFKDRIDIMDWNFTLKKRLNYQKSNPVISKDNSMKNIWYYGKSFLGKHFLYTLYFGVPFEEYLLNNYTGMEVFDLSGNPVCRYTFPQSDLASFVVDERSFTLYGYRGGDSISVYHLPWLKEYLENR